MMRTLLCLTALTLAWCSGARADEVTLDKLKSATPAGWKSVAPANKFRAYQFTVPKAEGDDKDAEVVIFFFGPGGGGSADDNIGRWKKMFQPPEGKKIDDVAKVSSYKVGPLDYVYLDVNGTYVTKDPKNPRAKEERYPDYRMLSVYFNCENGPYFIRLTGPAKTVGESKKGFDDWLKNFK